MKIPKDMTVYIAGKEYKGEIPDYLANLTGMVKVEEKKIAKPVKKTDDKSS